MTASLDALGFNGDFKALNPSSRQFPKSSSFPPVLQTTLVSDLSSDDAK